MPRIDDEDRVNMPEQPEANTGLAPCPVFYRTINATATRLINAMPAGNAAHFSPEQEESMRAVYYTAVRETLKSFLHLAEHPNINDLQDWADRTIQEVNIYLDVLQLCGLEAAAKGLAPAAEEYARRLIMENRPVSLDFDPGRPEQLFVVRDRTMREQILMMQGHMRTRTDGGGATTPVDNEGNPLKDGAISKLLEDWTPEGGKGGRA